MSFAAGQLRVQTESSSPRRCCRRKSQGRKPFRTSPSSIRNSSRSIRDSPHPMRARQPSVLRAPTTPTSRCVLFWDECQVKSGSEINEVLCQRENSTTNIFSNEVGANGATSVSGESPFNIQDQAISASEPRQNTLRVSWVHPVADCKSETATPMKDVSWGSPHRESGVLPNSATRTSSPESSFAAALEGATAAPNASAFELFGQQQTVGPPPIMVQPLFQPKSTLTARSQEAVFSASLSQGGNRRDQQNRRRHVSERTKRMPQSEDVTPHFTQSRSLFSPINCRQHGFGTPSLAQFNPSPEMNSAELEERAIREQVVEDLTNRLLEVSVEELGNLRRRARKHKPSKKELATERDQLKQRAETLGQQAKEASTERGELKEQVETLRAELKEVSTDRDTWKERVAALEEEVEALTIRVADKEKENDGIDVMTTPKKSNAEPYWEVGTTEENAPTSSLEETENLLESNTKARELKQECKKRGLPSTGKKEIMAARITAHDYYNGKTGASDFSFQDLNDKNHFGDMKKPQLQSECEKRGLLASGTKNVLNARLEGAAHACTPRKL